MVYTSSDSDSDTAHPNNTPLAKSGDFGAAFDSFNHLGFLFKPCSSGVGGSVPSVLSQFLSNPSQYVVVNGCHSKCVYVKTGAPRTLFWACSCSFCTPWCFYLQCRTSFAVMLTTSLLWLLCYLFLVLV